MGNGPNSTSTVKLIFLLAVLSVVATTISRLGIFGPNNFHFLETKNDATATAPTILSVPKKQPSEEFGDICHIADPMRVRGKYRKRGRGKDGNQLESFNPTEAIAATTVGSLGSKLNLPLQGPPYYVVQHGTPRSGSTFQYQLLQAILDLKSKRHTSSEEGTATTASSSPVAFMNTPVPYKWREVHKLTKTRSRTDMVYQGQDFFKPLVDFGFLQKTHDFDWVQKTICEFHKLKKQVAIFVSVTGSDRRENDDDDEHLRQILAPLTLTYGTGYIAHVQEINSADFRKCSSCEIEKYYRPIFDLSAREVQIVEDYTKQYSIIRKCCGSQMSKYNRLRLHGCDVSEYQNDNKHDYPWCENHTLPKIEESFANLIENHGLRPPENHSGWIKPGDCAESEDSVRAGSDFNNRKWSGECTLDSVRSEASFHKKKKRGKRRPK